jgi:hypothetical protein
VTENENQMAKEHRRPGWWMFVVVLLAFLAWAVVFIIRSSVQGLDGQRYFALFDDAMIAMRYAWNLAHGYGLVWNIGERVEGYTSLLMVLVMTPFSALIEDKSLAVLGIQILALPTLAAIAFLARSVFRRLEEIPANRSRPWLEAIQVAGSLWYYPLAYFTLMGMETGLLTVLLLGGVALAFRTADEGRSRDLVAAGAILGLAFLARPDALIFAALIYIWIGERVLSGGEKSLRVAWLASLGLFILFPLAQLGFRWLYYGELLPNTYILKVQGFPLMARIENGLAHIRPFLFDFLPVGLLAALATVLNFSRKRLLLVALFLASVAYTVWIGGDAWRMWRLIAPTVPLALAIAVEEAAAVESAVSISLRGPEWREYAERNPFLIRAVFRPIRDWARHRLPRLNALLVAGALLCLLAVAADSVGLSGPGFGEEQAILLATGLGLLAFHGINRWTRRGLPGPGAGLGLGAAALIAVALVSANQPFLREMTFRSLASDIEFNEWRIRVAQALMEVTSEHATLGVASAGFIPYYAERKAIDFLGKTDPHIAGLPADLSGAMRVGTVLAWPGHNKYDLDYSIGVLRPTYVQLLRWGSDDLCELLEDTYVAIDYRGVRLFLLRDSADVDWDAVFGVGVIPPTEDACSKGIP